MEIKLAPLVYNNKLKNKHKKNIKSIHKIMKKKIKKKSRNKIEKINAAKKRLTIRLMHIKNTN